MKEFMIVVYPQSGYHKIVRIVSCDDEATAEHYGAVIRNMVDPYAMYDVTEINGLIALLYKIFNRQNGPLAQR